MTTYAAPQTDSVATRVPPPAPRASPPAHTSPLPPTPVSAATAVAYIPPSAVPPGVHHHTPLHPNRHHQLPDNSWHNHHARLKRNHVHPPRLPPPPSDPSQIPSRRAKDVKSGNPESQSLHHSHSAHHGHEHASHVREGAPETPLSYHHTVNVIAPHHHASRLTAPTHHASYLYPVHQLVAPVAHVPIGAAHYAHLPPSIWNPPHAQFHQHPHAQPHQLPPTHHVNPAVVPAPHGQVPYSASHVPHVPAPQHPPPHAYALQTPHTATTAHPPPPGPPHSVHSAPHHPPQHITYTYAQVQPPPPSHHPVKTTLAVSPSQPVAAGGHVPYTMPATHLRQAPACTAVSAPLPCKAETVRGYAPQAEQPHPNGILTTGEGVKPYEMNGKRPGSTRMSNGTDDRTETGPAKLSKARPLPAESVQGNGKATDERKESNQKEKGQLPSGQSIRKPRKPYTIKKSREVWTPEEHSRFLQALQLYDRDWKKIESYIGTKTVLQIRSHAQKHFGKVTKYKTGEYIPPPRPKKRAALPYPRSRSAGQSKSSSANESSAEKTSGGDSGVHNASDTNAKNRIGTVRFSTGGRQGSSTLNNATNGSTQGAVGVTDSRKHPHTESATITAVEATEGTSRSMPYGDKYSPSSSERQNDHRSQECVQRGKLPETTPTRWHRGPPTEEPGRDQVPVTPRASSSSTDIKAGSSSCAREPHACQLHSSSYSEDLGRRYIRYDRDYHRHGISHALVSPENNSGSQRENCRSPKRLSSSQAVEHDTSTVKDSSRKKMMVPNNSLLVLSNCVDLMSRDKLPERQPAAGWAIAAAARRAHRAKIIRARKPPLPQPSILLQAEDPVHDDAGSPPRRIRDADILDEQSNRHRREHETVMKSLSTHLGSRSPPVNSPSEYGSDQPPPDPQRSPAGSGNGSDDAIAGFSSSDRPSVNGSAVGSGTGDSLETSDAGDPEDQEDPKSSNDGSGDDGNRRSPPTRDSSPSDPNSSGSRENSPNECPTPQPSNDGSQAQLDRSPQKAPERNGVAAERYEQVSQADKSNIDRQHLRTGPGMSEGDRENRRYGLHLEGNDKVLTNVDDRKSHMFPRTVLSASHDDPVSLHSRPPRVDRGIQMHQHAIHELSPSSKKRLRPNMEYDIHTRTDGGTGEDGRDPESKRQRMRHTVKETNSAADETYHSRDDTERNR